MRIDKLISEAGYASRNEAAKAARKGNVTVNGVEVKDLSRHIDPEKDVVTFFGEVVEYITSVYIMLNKPEGYVSATEDSRLPVVTELLPEELRHRELFPVGRLDRDTVGLMILTNDGQLAHTLLSPRRHVTKLYRFRAAEPVCEGAEEKFRDGITLADGYECKSAVISLDPDRMGGLIELTEGKYHQIKRMIASLDNRVVYLERVQFAGISLDGSLERGEWRHLSAGEVSSLREKAGAIQ